MESAPYPNAHASLIPQSQSKFYPTCSFRPCCLFIYRIPTSSHPYFLACISITHLNSLSPLRIHTIVDHPPCHSQVHDTDTCYPLPILLPLPLPPSLTATSHTFTPHSRIHTHILAQTDYPFSPHQLPPSVRAELHVSTPFHCELSCVPAADYKARQYPALPFKMILRESESTNMGRGAYDTTGTPKPPPPKPSRR